MTKKITVKNPNKLPTIDHHKLKILQGDLKTLSEENLTKLCNSIKRYGYFVPAFIWRSGNDFWILDATQRYRALEQLEKESYEIPEIPYIEIEAKDKKDAAEKLLQITSRYGTINPETTFFEDFDIDLNFINDIEIPELNIKLEDLVPEIIEDDVPEPPAEPISKTGDLWICGRHRVLCGDATNEADIRRLLDNKKADLVFTDPPYGMDLDTDWSDAKSSLEFLKHTGAKAHGGKWDKVIGDNKSFDIQPFLELLKTTKEQFWFGADYYAKTLPEGGSWFVWDKRLTEEFDKMYGSCFELIWSKNQHRREIIRVKWAGIFGTETQDIQTRMHPTQKPIEVPAWFINKFSKETDLIADFFLGSGTTLIACEQLKRICYGCEISEPYCDVIIERFINYKNNNKDIYLQLESGEKKSWEEVKAERRSSVW